MLDKVRQLLKLDEHKPLAKAPFHVAITMNGIKRWAKKHDISIENGYEKSFLALNEIIRTQVDEKIRIVSIYVIPELSKSGILITDNFIEFINSLAVSDFVHKNQIKISVIGKWYDLPDRAIDPIKKVISETKDYDNFFFNLCVNYDGQEEIVDSVRLILRKAYADKLDPEIISKELIKENIYSSYFLPPDILIKTGYKRRTLGFLLWDSKDAHIYFCDKPFPEISKKDIYSALKEWEKYKQYIYS